VSESTCHYLHFYTTKRAFHLRTVYLVRRDRSMTLATLISDSRRTGRASSRASSGA
jgi:hypothetical protein